MTDAHKIAAGLTEAQAAYFLGELPSLRPASEAQMLWRLKSLGLLEIRTAPTPFGLEVRAILETRND